MRRTWHAVLAMVGLVALVGQTVLVVRGGTGLLDLFSYFTIQSNLLVLVAATVIALGAEPSGRAWRALRLAGLVGITVTGVVYTVAIGPYVDFEGITWWYDKMFHYAVPLMAVVGHVAFRPRTPFAPRDLVFIVWPVLWLGYTLLRAEVGSPSFAAATDGVSRYPYDFLDVDAQGAASVAVAAVVVTLLLLALAAVYVRLGRAPATTPA